MIGDIVSDLWNWHFGAGIIVGAACQRLYCFTRARLADRRDPLPNGQHRRIGGLSKVWIVGAVVMLVTGYYVVEAQHLANCQKEFGEVLAKRSAITAENDELSRKERSAFANWLADLLNPPDPAIMAMDPQDPRRQEYSLERSRYWYTVIATAEAQQVANDEVRRKNPIPDPTCGRGL